GRWGGGGRGRRGGWGGRGASPRGARGEPAWWRRGRVGRVHIGNLIRSSGVAAAATGPESSRWRGPYPLQRLDSHRHDIAHRDGLQRPEWLAKAAPDPGPDLAIEGPDQVADGLAVGTQLAAA